MVNSLVRELLSRVPIGDKSKDETIKGGPRTADDEELEAILTGLKINIKIIGCGGGGSNTINRLVEEGVVGADLYAANTDAQHLLRVHSPHKLLLGKRTTKGLGAGARPEIGEEAARESEETLRKILTGADMVFITCGLGGGTGTGAAPVIAKIAKEVGALTITICTFPFKSEGINRMENAQYGLEKLRQVTDTVIVIPNDRLLALVPRLPLEYAFRVADEILVRAIKGITEVVTKPGLVNLDFNDLRTIMKSGGESLIGLGESDGDNRAIEAVEEAINSPLIDADISGATGALINVTGGNDMTLAEAEYISEYIRGRIAPNAKIIWGANIDDTFEHLVRVMVVLTGVKSSQIYGPTSAPVMKFGTEIDFVR